MRLILQSQTQISVARHPVALVDAESIVLDASLGNNFYVTLGGNRTLANPLNPTDGQVILVQVGQDTTGSRMLALENAFGFSVDAPSTSFILSTTPGKIDVFSALYNSKVIKWLVLSLLRGF